MTHLLIRRVDAPRKQVGQTTHPTPTFQSVAWQAGKPAPLTQRLAGEICNTGACEGYVTGKIGPEDSGYRLEVSLFREGRTRPVVALSRLAPSEDDLLETIRELMRDLRLGAGEDPE